MTRSEYVDYFTGQMRSLNAAFTAGEFEDDEGGNGVYESFRAGYRVLNWLQVRARCLNWAKCVGQSVCAGRYLSNHRAQQRTFAV